MTDLIGITFLKFLKHFSKTKSTFDDHTKCLRFSIEYLDKIENPNNNSPIATILAFESEIEKFRKKMQMPDMTHKSDGSWGCDVTTLFVEIYEVGFLIFDNVEKFIQLIHYNL